MKNIDLSIVENAMTYQEYAEKVADLLEKGIVSTASTYEPTEEMMHYTRMNLQRMHRLDKMVKLTAETTKQLNALKQNRIWLVLSEGWCGDAGQVVPVIEKIAIQNTHIKHRILLRDEHLDIMDAFLTDEGRSIPKLIVLDEKGTVLSSWGPRPKALQDIMVLQKAKLLALPKDERKAYFDVIKTEVQQWYNRDKTVSIQKELLDAVGL
jgi:hypothetical protein